MENLENLLVPILVPLGAFGFVVLLRWLGERTAQTKAKLRAESQKQLLDKFTSPRELADFMETEGGKRFLGELTSNEGSPYAKILRFVRAGVILAVLGLGLLGLMRWERGFIFPAVIVLAIGAGFLIAAGVSYRLSSKWGLLKDAATSVGRRPIS